MSDHERRMTPLKGRKVTVIGLGRFGGGIGVTRFLAAQGARVVVSDKAPAGELEQSIKALEGLDVTLHLGGHLEEDFLGCDLLVVNPAVPKDMPLLAAAARAGVEMTTEINLFLERCSAQTVGITGSVGKSTTTAMIGEILRRQFVTHVGGNIGKSLLEELPSIQPEHVVVLELSSFQLEDVVQVKISPHIAVVTNLIPNHLDRHGNMEAYGDAKKSIYRFQGPDDVLVLNSADPVSGVWAAEAPGKVVYFDGSGEGDFELPLPGRHNQANAQAAWQTVRQLGIDIDTTRAALKRFSGLPHRLQFVAEKDSIRYFNDSKCTTPQGAVVAVNSFEPRKAIMIVGGYDKHVSFDEMAVVLAQRAKAVVAIGATARQIVDALEQHRTGDQPAVARADDLAAAVAAARKFAAAGDAVLLSPACASYDMFTNYEQRGEAFCELVRAM